MPLDLTNGVDGLYPEGTSLLGPGFFPAGLGGVFTPPDAIDVSQFLPGTDTFDSGAGMPFSSSETREYTRKLKVGTRNKSYANVMTMLRHPLVPQAYTPYVSSDGRIVDPCALAVKFRADPILPERDWQWWIVTVEYSTDMPEGGPNPFVQLPDQLVGPLNRPWQERPVLTRDVEEVAEAFPCDLKGKPYWSSARTPLQPAPVRQVEHMVYVFERNMPTFMATDVVVTQYHNRLNDRVFLGRPRGCVKCSWKVGPLKYRGKIPYYRSTLTFRVKIRNIPDPTATPGPNVPMVPETWQTNYIDADTHRLMTVPGASLFDIPLKDMPVPLMIANQQVTHPYPLDGHGQPARPDPVTKVIYPTYLRFDDFEYADLSVLFQNMG